MLIKPIILCGGTGSRLWPSSRKSYPKQFIPFINNQSLLELTIDRVQNIKKTSIPLIIGSQKHNFFINKIVNKTNFKSKLIFEPSPKNTTAAIYLAALFSQHDDFLVIMPSDHLMPDREYFSNVLLKTYQNINKGEWLTFGIKPRNPSDSYGYIETKLDDTYDFQNLNQVIRFVEKPSKQIAKEMIKNNNYFWNAGIFGAHQSTIINSIKEHAPDVALHCDALFHKAKFCLNDDEIYFDPQKFELIPSISIDYAVMENEKNIKLVQYNKSWSDIGSWDAFIEHNEANLNMHSNNKIIEIDTHNNKIISENSIIAAIGIKDTIIIENDGAILISKKGKTEKVRDIVEQLNKNKIKEGQEHSYEFRPWGKFEILLDDFMCKVKRLYVDPGKRLSLQYHKKRSEHWTVISGLAKVYLNKKIIELKSGQSIDIPVEAHHYIENSTKEELIIIETQMGTYFGEDDIVRIDDPFKR